MQLYWTSLPLPPFPGDLSRKRARCSLCSGSGSLQHLQQHRIELLRRFIRHPMAGALGSSARRRRGAIHAARRHAAAHEDWLARRARPRCHSPAIQSWPALRQGAAARQSRGLQARVARVPFLDGQRRVIDACRIGDHQAAEVDAMRARRVPDRSGAAPSSVRPRCPSGPTPLEPMMVTERTRAPWIAPTQVAIVPPNEKPATSVSGVCAEHAIDTGCNYRGDRHGVVANRRKCGLAKTRQVRDQQTIGCDSTSILCAQ